MPYSSVGFPAHDSCQLNADFAATVILEVYGAQAVPKVERNQRNEEREVERLESCDVLYRHISLHRLYVNSTDCS